MELEILSLPDINPEDTVYRTPDGVIVKVRVREDPLLHAPAEVRRSCLAYHFSASLCDEHGKALPDANDPSGFQIAPIEPLTIQIQGMQEKAAKEGIAIDALIEQTIEEYRRKQVAAALSFDPVRRLRGRFPAVSA